MRIPLLVGREFDDNDRRGQPEVAIVNETFALRYFGTPEAVGRTFSVSGGRRQLTIVGITRDIKIYTLGEAAAPYYYVPWRQFLVSDTGIAVHIRTTAADPLTLLPAVRQAIRALDPQLPIFEALTLAEHTSAARFAQKIAASLLAVLSAVALALAALGLYGVLAFTVAQRTPEIGLRLALGAAPRDIARLVLSRGAALVVVGLGVGLLAAIVIARLLAAILYGVSTFEPVLLAATLPPLLLAAFAACWLPARRAARVDPMTALRAE
jgi:ABC-type antimicrobial peptide transport system permease subunit